MTYFEASRKPSNGWAHANHPDQILFLTVDAIRTKFRCGGKSLYDFIKKYNLDRKAIFSKCFDKNDGYKKVIIAVMNDNPTLLT